MKNQADPAMPSLVELEAEAEEYGRNVAREYLEEKLQQLADQQGEVFPPERKAAVASKAPARQTARGSRRNRSGTVVRARSR